MIRTMERILGDFEHGRIDRRQTLAVLAGLVVAASGARGDDRTAKPSTFQATGVDHVALRVTDVARSRDFYVEHLGLAVSRDNAPSNCFLDCGDDFLALFRGDTPGMDHFSFAIDDYDAGSVVDTLKRAGLEPERHQNRVYFPDPDGLTVQISRGSR